VTDSPFEIYAKSPTRVDFAGGTLDLWPLYNFLNDAKTINLAIDIYTHAILRPKSSSEIILKVKDLDCEKQYANLAECLSDADEKFLLLRKHIAYWRPMQGFELITWSESPIGGGLGGSSSLSVSISGAFAHWQNIKLETHPWVNLVHNVEAQVLKMPTGTQDYYPPILGGLNTLHYRVDACHIKKWKFPVETFDQSFLLVYTGKPHHSGFNNWQVYKDVIDDKKETVESLKELKAVSERMHKVCEHGRWQELAQIFNDEYNARVKISKVFTSPEIERLKEVSLRAGAQAVKICGAGGGGCVLVWCQPDSRDEVARACEKENFQVLKAKGVEQGHVVVRRAVGKAN